MPDLEVIALLKAKPGSEDVVRSALATLVEATRAEEGCLAYQLYVSGADASTFVTVETWRGQADLDAHLQTPHVQELRRTAGSHFAAAPEVHPLHPVV